MMNGNVNFGGPRPEIRPPATRGMSRFGSWRDWAHPVYYFLPKRLRTKSPTPIQSAAAAHTTPTVTQTTTT